MRGVAKRFARVEDQQLSNIQARNHALALHLPPFTPNRGEPAQTRHHALERGAPFVRRPPQHRERQNHDLQREREPDERRETFFRRTQSQLRWLWNTKKSLSDFALTAPIEKEVLPSVPDWLARTVIGSLRLVIDFHDGASNG